MDALEKAKRRKGGGEGDFGGAVRGEEAREGEGGEREGMAEGMADTPVEMMDREDAGTQWRGLRNVMFCMDASEASDATPYWAFVNGAVRVAGEVPGEGEIEDVHAGEPVSYPNSEEAEAKALEAVREAMAAPCDMVHVVHVCPYPTPSSAAPYAGFASGAFAVGDDYSVRMKATEDEAKGLVKRTMERLMARGVAKGCIRGEVLWVDSGSAGTIGDRLVKYADMHGVDLMVIGSRGIGAVKGALLGMVGLGSVSQRVSHGAKCPVLLIKPSSPKSSASDVAQEGTKAHDE